MTVRLSLVGISSMLYVDVPSSTLILNELGLFEDPRTVQWVSTIKIPVEHTRIRQNLEYSRLSVDTCAHYKVCARTIDPDTPLPDPPVVDLQTAPDPRDPAEVCVFCEGTYISYASVIPTT